MWSAFIFCGSGSSCFFSLCGSAFKSVLQYEFPCIFLLLFWHFPLLDPDPCPELMSTALHIFSFPFHISNIISSILVSDSEQPAAGQSFPSPYTQETDPVPPLAPSYDQLRRRNREQGGFVVPQPSPAVAPLPPSPPPYQQPPDSSSLYRPMPVPKGGNKYGDEGFE